ncbi:MAG: hypothetical protein L6247_05790 [Desulfobacteraceae bacterium]|nr:hypothetical protein [Desulfobacteraceae bacterium]
MSINEELLEIKTYTGAGYMPLIDYDTWRVALMRWCDDYLPHNITTMACHDETDEVFVLLHGRCILFIGEGQADGITKIHAQEMKPSYLYNVKRGVWHSHTFDEDALVLIVENRDTTDRNSRLVDLSDNKRRQIVELTDTMWGR